MTISSNTRKAGPFIGNGTAATFPFTFKVFQPIDLRVVKLITASSTEVDLVLNSDFTAVVNPDQNSLPGGSITLIGGNLATGNNLVITSDIENLQPTDLTNQGGFYPEVITDALDRSTIQIQQQQDAVDRSIKFSLTNSAASNEITATPAARANKVLSFDAAGEFQITQELGQSQGDWTVGFSYSPRDLARDSSNGNVYICMAAHVASGSLPLKTNPQISLWDLIVDAETAGDYANSAAESAAESAASALTANADAALAASARDDANVAKVAAQASQAAAAASAADADADAIIAAAEAAAAAISAAAAEEAAASAIASAGGGAVKVSATDTNANYLGLKFEAGVDIEITTVNPGGDEKLRVSAPYAVAYAIALGG